jgi:uncharacterized coiled-coil protein SlyX
MNYSEIIQNAVSLAKAVISKRQLVCPACGHVPAKFTRKGKTGDSYQFVCCDCSRSFVIGRIKDQLIRAAATAEERDLMRQIRTTGPVVGIPTKKGPKGKAESKPESFSKTTPVLIGSSKSPLPASTGNGPSSHDDGAFSQMSSLIDEIAKAITANVVQSMNQILTESTMKIERLQAQVDILSAKVTQFELPAQGKVLGTVERPTFSEVAQAQRQSSEKFADSQQQVCFSANLRKDGVQKRKERTVSHRDFPRDIVKRRFTNGQNLSRLVNGSCASVRTMVSRLVVAKRCPIKVLRKQLSLAQCPSYVFSDMYFIGSNILSITVDEQYVENLEKFFDSHGIYMFPESTTVFDDSVKPYIKPDIEEELTYSLIERHEHARACPDRIKRNALLVAIGDDVIRSIETMRKPGALLGYVLREAERKIRNRGDSELFAFLSARSDIYNAEECILAYEQFSTKLAGVKAARAKKLANRRNKKANPCG